MQIFIYCKDTLHDSGVTAQSDFAVNKYLHTVSSGWIFINRDFSVFSVVSTYRSFPSGTFTPAAHFVCTDLDIFKIHNVIRKQLLHYQLYCYQLNCSVESEIAFCVKSEQFFSLNMAFNSQIFAALFCFQFCSVYFSDFAYKYMP